MRCTRASRARGLAFSTLAETRSGFVLVTVRSGEPLPDPITALWKDELALRLELLGLSVSHIEQLLREVLSGQVDPAATPNT